MSKRLKYKRILLKLTGELFGEEQRRGLHFPSIAQLALEIKTIKEHYPELQLAILPGAGNLFRGREAIGSAPNVSKATADHIGMLGTIMNSLALQAELEALGTDTRVLSSLEIRAVCEPYILRRATRHLEKGRIVILAGGSGMPFFTTDTAAAHKACELNCDVLLKASTVEGVFNTDPKKNRAAVKYDELSYAEALGKGLMVMDNTAFALCQREQVPIIVFNIDPLQNIERILNGEAIGTLIK